MVDRHGAVGWAAGARVAKSMWSSASSSGMDVRRTSSMPEGAAMAMYLPQSMTDPPPTSTTTASSVPKSRMAATPAATLVSLGLGSTPVKAVHSMPSSVRAAVAVSRMPAALRPGSLTTKARLAWARTCWASPVTLFSPTTVVGMGVRVKGVICVGPPWDAETAGRLPDTTLPNPGFAPDPVGPLANA